jgi:hypothetical protein
MLSLTNVLFLKKSMRDQYSNLVTKFEFLLSELLQIESQQLFLLDKQGPYIAMKI